MLNFLQSLNINEELFLIALSALVVILLILLIFTLIRTNKVFKRYDYFMRGKDAESLEDMIVEIHSKMYSLQDQEMENRDRAKLLQIGMNNSYQKTGIVKYNAFDGMGGQSSFALALLDQNNSGIILNAMHSRQSCYLYIKQVISGQAESSLGAEEKAELERAMNRKPQFS